MARRSGAAVHEGCAPLGAGIEDGGAVDPPPQATKFGVRVGETDFLCSQAFRSSQRGAGGCPGLSPTRAAGDFQAPRGGLGGSGGKLCSKGRQEASGGGRGGRTRRVLQPGDARGWAPQRLQHPRVPGGRWGAAAAARRMWSGAEQQPGSRAGSARPRQHSSSQEQDPAPLTLLSSLPQVPGRWRASWRGFAWAPPWPRRSSSPSTTRISRGHIATDETLGLLPAAAQISTGLDSRAGSPAPSSPRTSGGLFRSAPHRRGVSGAPRVCPSSPSSQLCCLWLIK